MDGKQSRGCGVNLTASERELFICVIYLLELMFTLFSYSLARFCYIIETRRYANTSNQCPQTFNSHCPAKSMAEEQIKFRFRANEKTRAIDSCLRYVFFTQARV